MLNVGEADGGGVAFLGYRQFQDGSQGPAERENLIRKIGDVIIAVNGQSTVGKSFKEVIPKLRESPVFSYMRLVHADYGMDGGFTSSCGTLGKFMNYDLSKTFKADRRRLLARRTLALIDEKDGDNSSTDDAADDLDDDDSDSDESASGIESDSEDEALLHEKSAGDSDASMTDPQVTNRVPCIDSDPVRAQGNEEEKSTTERKVSDVIDSVLIQQESTRHLAFGLLDLDVGYSSDEGGDEDVAYYVSNVELFSCLTLLIRLTSITV